MNRFARNNALIGDDGQKMLNGSSVLIVGVGGVGGYAVEMLARCGVGAITVVDSDDIDVTNINRQIIALESTVGLAKVDVVSDRLRDINPDLSIDAHKMRFSKDTAETIFSSRKFDYCIDAIDSVKDKVDLILECKSRNIPCISALGAGNRLYTEFKAVDIFSTSGDGLAKVVRSALRKAGITNHRTVCATTPAITNAVPPSSISYVPAMMGCVLAREVIKCLLDR